MVTHRVHQVGLTQADATIKEQRVVPVLGVVRHLPGGRAGELVGFTFDEVFEGEGAVQVAGVLERTFDLHGALFGANRGLLRSGTGHRIETVARRFIADFRAFLRRALGRRCGRLRRCLRTHRRGICLGLLGNLRGCKRRIRCGTRSGTAFAAY
ncbi:hypothetical protein D3C84_639630 [compost metagenome]